MALETIEPLGGLSCGFPTEVRMASETVMFPGWLLLRPLRTLRPLLPTTCHDRYVRYHTRAGRNPGYRY